VHWLAFCQDFSAFRAAAVPQDRTQSLSTRGVGETLEPGGQALGGVELVLVAWDPSAKIP
jgi:hypothetical protein